MTIQSPYSNPVAGATMEGPPFFQPTFVRPKKVSAAVPIIDPASREQQPLVSSPHIEHRTTNLLLKQQAQAQRDAAHAAEVARAQLEKFQISQNVLGQAGYRVPDPVSPQSNGISIRTDAASSYVTAPKIVSPPISPLKAIRGDSDDELERGFDVYAAPFVPDKIKAINTLPGRVADTLPSKNINFTAYAEETLGSSLLPPLKNLDANYSFQAASASEPTLTPLSYEHFFRFHIDSEYQAQQLENSSYSLYGHEGILEFLPEKQARVTVVVPGLRENSPYVEEDDTVQLRQLRFDNVGRLVEHWIFPPEIFTPYYPSGPWTEIIYNARVAAVKRATEEVVLVVSGLTLQSSEVLLGVPQGQLLPPQHHLKFNIQFPVPAQRYLHMKQALPQIQASLVRASQITYQSAPGGIGNNQAASTNQFWIQSMLFPTEADCDVQANAHSGIFSLEFYERILNHEQRIAVEDVCGQNYGVMPYLISGPPGTGKTKTMIEIALQLVNNVAAVSHILMCAPSEQAADTLVDRLRVYLQPYEMLRLNRPTRAFNEVPDTVRQYCFYGEDMFGMPPFEKLMSYKLVVTSCRDAQMLMYARMSNTDLYTVESRLRKLIHPTEASPSKVRLHWDALLMDEAAQATEPEALVPLYVVAPPADAPEVLFTPLLVMAGDEHQLNPRTSSPHTPLQRSLFTRLFARPVYADHPLARRFCVPGVPAPTSVQLPILRPAFTNLVRNYRSHPAILAVPSHLFYADTLIPKALSASITRLAQWGGWTRPGWPVMFHNNGSRDELERDGGGWFNDGEAHLACDYVRRLARSGLVAETDICIMSPFKAQVRHIRKLIREPKYQLWGVNVGPTEAYQGLEYGVVILCVTRSRQRFVRRDQELGWGVIGMKNKMNVALTRAKFGLIVLARRELLVGEDEGWKAVVEFCERNGLVTGDGYAGQGGKVTGEPRTMIEKQLRAGEQIAADDAAWMRWQAAQAAQARVVPPQ